MSAGKHVVITGGAGFVGSHLCERFLRAGYAVTAVDNFLTGRPANVASFGSRPDFLLVEADVARPLATPIEETALARRLGIHGVLHFACPASPVDFDRLPFEILAVDSVGTQLTADWALRAGARYVLASTSEVYGDPLVHPQDESYWGNVNPIGPRACYDEAKRFGEAYVSTAVRSPRHRLDGGIVRIFNTYGPRMRLDDGRIVPELCVQALAGRPLTIHGDGRQTRSFCFVTDLVEGIFRFFERPGEMGPVNLGNPREFTVLEFAETVLRLTGGKSELVRTPGRPDDPRQRRPVIDRARALLDGWEPRIALEDGLRETIEHFKRELAKKAN